MHKITPFSGWLLDRAVEIDSHSPGIAGHLFRCSRERRHVIAAYLSREAPAHRFDTLAQVGDFLSRATHDEILNAAFEVVPSGFRGALGRGGDQPYVRRHYGYLHALMASTARPEMCRLLKRLTRINPTRLAIARAFPNDLRATGLVEIIRDVAVARDLARLINLMTESGGDRAAMIRALIDVSSVDEINDWARRWAFRLRLPEHPVPASAVYKPITHGEDLRKMARNYRNCARNYLTNTLEGRSAFAVAADNDHHAVVHLVHERGQWVLDDIYAAKNRTPDSDLTAKVVAHLEQHGVLPRQASAGPDRPWACLRRFAGHYDYDFDEA